MIDHTTDEERHHLAGRRAAVAARLLPFRCMGAAARADRRRVRRHI